MDSEQYEERLVVTLLASEAQEGVWVYGGKCQSPERLWIALSNKNLNLHTWRMVRAHSPTCRCQELWGEPLWRTQLSARAVRQ